MSLVTLNPVLTLSVDGDAGLSCGHLVSFFFGMATAILGFVMLRSQLFDVKPQDCPLFK